MRSVEEIEIGPVRVAGLAARVRNSQPEGIGAHWRRFHADATVAQLRGVVSNNALAVYTEYESDYSGEFTMLLGYHVAVDSIVPAGLRVIEIPRQNYAVLLAQGEQPQALWSAWEWVWASALRRAYTADFDEYLTDFDVRVHVAVLA